MTMMRRRLSLASCLLLAAVVHSSALPMAGQQSARRIESDKYIVRIIESTRPNQDSLGDHILLVIDKREKLAFRLEALGSGTFDSMNLYADRLVFFGWFGTNAQGVMVFDLSERELIDSFLCWYKTVSPSGRWLAYTWRYNRWAHDLYSDILLLYDLKRPPTENRVTGSMGRGGENVGVPVYPPENASPRNYTPWIGEKPEAKHDLRLHEPSFHAWIERDRKLLLIDQTPTEMKFVALEFWDDAQQATIRLGDIPEDAAEGIQQRPEVALSVNEGRGQIVFKRCVDCVSETISVQLYPAP